MQPGHWSLRIQTQKEAGSGREGGGLWLRKGRAPAEEAGSGREGGGLWLIGPVGWKQALSEAPQQEAVSTLTEKQVTQAATVPAVNVLGGNLSLLCRGRLGMVSFHPASF